MNKLIALVGMCGSGKSVVTKSFTDAGYTLVYFGGVTMDELARRNLPRNEQNERMVREELRKEFGPAAFAIKSLEKIKTGLNSGSVIIDGLYSWSEYRVLKEEFPFLMVIAVVTDRALRYERLAMRPVRPLTLEEAQSRDYAEIEHSEKGGPIAIADFYISNNGSPEELNRKLSQFLKTL